MTRYSTEQVLEKIRRGESLERLDLRDLTLDQGLFEGIDLRRADLEGASLEGTYLRHANLSCANLRDAYLVNANLEGANLQKSDLDGANLEGANLQFADLSYASFEGARLEHANLNGARLSYAQFGVANLGGASLEGAELTHTDLSECYLGAAKLAKAHCEHATLAKANLEEADFAGANLSGAILSQACAEGAIFTGAILQGAVLQETALTHANLSMADLRQCNLANANLTKAVLNGAKVFGIEANASQFREVLADWVDFSAEGNGEIRVKGVDFRENYERVKQGLGASVSTLLDQPKRFFGQGDVLRNAILEFNEHSQIEIEGLLEKCTIVLGSGTTLTIGPNGVLKGCQIMGGGEIVVLGKFFEDGLFPSIQGPSRFVVGKTGVVRGAMQQAVLPTQFGFEHGCSLSLKIRKAEE